MPSSTSRGRSRSGSTPPISFRRWVSCRWRIRDAWRWWRRGGRRRCCRRRGRRLRPTCRARTGRSASRRTARCGWSRSPSSPARQVTPCVRTTPAPSASRSRSVSTGYVRSTYKAKTLARWQTSDFYDVARPLRIELETADAGIGTVTDETVTVVLPLSELFERLPDFLREPDGAAHKRAAASAVRTLDYVYQDAHAHELRYKMSRRTASRPIRCPPTSRSRWGRRATRRLTGSSATASSPRRSGSIRASRASRRRS